MADPTEANEAEDQGSDRDKNWRKLEDRAKKAEEKYAQLERELAFTKAGLDHLSDKQVKALTAAHEGEITAEALKATATELGFPSKAATGQSTPEAASETDHSDEARELANLSDSPASHEAGSSGRMTQEAFDKKVDECQTDEELQAFLEANVDLISPL